MKFTTTKRIFALALGLALSGTLPAQDNEGIAEVVRITPKPGHEATLIQAITDYHHWIASFEGHMEYTWYEVLTGPGTGTYIARSGGHNWADFDAKHDWEDKADEVFRNNIAPHVEHVERVMTQDVNDLSYWPEDMQAYTHFQLESWYVVNGQYGKFRRGLKKIVDTLKAGNFGGRFGFISVASGGHGNEIIFVMPNRGWADMTANDPSFMDIMTREIGGPEKLDAFMADWGSTYKVGTNMMVKRMPEASNYSKDKD